MKVQNFEDLAIYQKSCELAEQVYKITRTGEFKHDTRFVQHGIRGTRNQGDRTFHTLTIHQ